MNAVDKLMRNFTIRLRMLGAIGMVVLLLVMVGGAGLIGMFRIQSLSDQVSQQTLTVNTHMASLGEQIAYLRRHEKDLIINYEKAEAITALKAKWQASLKLTLAEVKSLGDAEHGLDRAAIEQVGKQVQGYATAFEPVLKQIEASAYDSATTISKVSAKAAAMMQAAEQGLASLRQANAKLADAAREDMRASVNRTLATFGAALAAAILLVVPLTLINSASILRPMRQANELARAIASGDLTHPVNDQGRDESADLLRSLNAMQDYLRKLVGQIRASADSIQTASAEVASGNTDLSQRTEQAASNLQQTASSMEQLTGTVRQSADAASQANQLASSASAVAQRGGSVVSQVVATMNDINTSSKKIADIIGVIDGIAFQTNILALNAAVEAARAGEQGRGFAVVAGEVRSLAQRSAEAAREIKTLIGASVERVESGARLVQDAGSTMTEIVASVQRVSDIIGEITAASSEQSSGIGQINGAVVQLDQMTQQNAALVEESAAAAESLKEQAHRLADAVGVFKLEQSA
ncbi:methyl-accepting chemotaxis protein [Aquabacterium sp.]|uniref:methyl-accepting chemotaxis protein n=1 Tax=Aquabacterium sp. TaxID=1872578 RepID=UPI002BDE7B1D|nr:methyl-accepting chemotaxis protein [Aquabacterium sp.]HSW07201.1 methyl-accepting chemotaxis protein [Aquabacterium sp.]